LAGRRGGSSSACGIEEGETGVRVGGGLGGFFSSRSKKEENSDSRSRVSLCSTNKPNFRGWKEKGDLLPPGLGKGENVAFRGEEKRKKENPSKGKGISPHVN